MGICIPSRYWVANHQFLRSFEFLWFVHAFLCPLSAIRSHEILWVFVSEEHGGRTRKRSKSTRQKARVKCTNPVGSPQFSDHSHSRSLRGDLNLAFNCIKRKDRGPKTHTGYSTTEQSRAESEILTFGFCQSANYGFAAFIAKKEEKATGNFPSQGWTQTLKELSKTFLTNDLTG